MNEISVSVSSCFTNEHIKYQKHRSNFPLITSKTDIGNWISAGVLKVTRLTKQLRHPSLSINISQAPVLQFLWSSGL
ncbi:unnamed protein product [Schistosoma guineensis]|nr:unnamed protein product [Schistosoma guineensis]CAH8562767.1 unnamed protein product [Schistosoma haematobium]CAH8567531.1 unnamed protein product [Schistosoma haematobium]